MPHLLPFPHFFRLPAGQIDALPLTRNGVRRMDPFPFVRQAGPCLPQLTVTDRGGRPPVRGICGLLPTAAFLDGRVRAHENTLLPRLERQRRLVLDDDGALGKPILLTVPSLNTLWPRLLPYPPEELLTFRGAQGEYKLYSGQRAETPIELSDLGPLVVADGHHRAYTHAALAAEGHAAFQLLPVVVAGADELSIGTFLRVIEGDGMSLGQLLHVLRSYFHITPIAAGKCVTAPGHWLLSYRGCHHHLQRRPSENEDTDTGWLTRVVLPAVFGITDMRHDPRIHSIYPPASSAGIIQFPVALREKITLLGYPISRQRFFTEALAGRVLPPKSTRFLPRIPSGLLVWIPT